jgi:hypothetical protein
MTLQTPDDFVLGDREPFQLDNAICHELSRAIGGFVECLKL